MRRIRSLLHSLQGPHNEPSSKGVRALNGNHPNSSEKHLVEYPPSLTFLSASPVYQKENGSYPLIDNLSGRFLLNYVHGTFDEFKRCL